MNPAGPIKLVSQVIDLPLLDKDDRWCGIVDDIELEGAPGKVTRVKALLVGPGAYRGRLPHWLFWLVEQLAGNRISRVPFAEIESITSAVHLRCPAEKLGLHAVENQARAWIPRKGAM